MAHVRGESAQQSSSGRAPTPPADPPAPRRSASCLLHFHRHPLPPQGRRSQPAGSTPPRRTLSPLRAMPTAVRHHHHRLPLRLRSPALGRAAECLPKSLRRTSRGPAPPAAAHAQVHPPPPPRPPGTAATRPPAQAAQPRPRPRRSASSAAGWPSCSRPRRTPERDRVQCCSPPPGPAAARVSSRARHTCGA